MDEKALGHISQETRCEDSKDVLKEKSSESSKGSPDNISGNVILPEKDLHEIENPDNKSISDGFSQKAESKEDDEKSSEQPDAFVEDRNGVHVSQPKLSKNQIRKRKRLEKLMEKKKRKKELAKEARIAKAKAEGRDLEKERREQEERRISGEGHRRREEAWIRRMRDADQRFRICLDCSFDEHMSRKEKNSLALQIRYCYAQNKRSANPCYFSVANLNGMTLEFLEKVAGFPDQWFQRAFSTSKQSLIEIHPDKSKLIYLTGDSENTLDELDDDKIYVIGGIVDRNRLTHATISKAKALGIATAKIPIEEHISFSATKILTCNHVFEILLKYREHGNDWKKALVDVLPKRKDIKEVDTERE